MNKGKVFGNSDVRAEEFRHTMNRDGIPASTLSAGADWEWLRELWKRLLALRRN